MISGGMFDFWNKKEFRKAKKSKVKNQNQNDANENTNEQIKPLTIAQLQSAYYFFVIGICASFLSFAFEMIFKFQCI